MSRDSELNFLGWDLGIRIIKKSPNASNVHAELGTTASRGDPDLCATPQQAHSAAGSLAQGGHPAGLSHSQFLAGPKRTR